MTSEVNYCTKVQYLNQEPLLEVNQDRKDHCEASKKKKSKKIKDVWKEGTLKEIRLHTGGKASQGSQGPLEGNLPGEISGDKPLIETGDF
jgi:hypothetical protein